MVVAVRDATAAERPVASPRSLRPAAAMLLVVSVGAMVVTPLVFLPWSRSIWVALDLGLLQRLEPGDGESDLRRRNAP